MFAGASGRFSTDLDFAVTDLSETPAAVQALVNEAVHGATIGPFRYRIAARRGRSHIVYEHDLAPTRMGLTSKLDIGPPTWLAPVPRSWVPLPTHERYGGPLPQLPTVTIEEHVAEKIARLNRRTRTTLAVTRRAANWPATRDRTQVLHDVARFPPDSSISSEKTGNNQIRTR